VWAKFNVFVMLEQEVHTVTGGLQSVNVWDYKKLQFYLFCMAVKQFRFVTRIYNLIVSGNKLPKKISHTNNDKVPKTGEAYIMGNF
jgi:hypothetical protein